MLLRLDRRNFCLAPVAAYNFLVAVVLLVTVAPVAAYVCARLVIPKIGVSATTRLRVRHRLRVSGDIEHRRQCSMCAAHQIMAQMVVNCRQPSYRFQMTAWDGRAAAALDTAQLARPARDLAVVRDHMDGWCTLASVTSTPQPRHPRGVWRHARYRYSTRLSTVQRSALVRHTRPHPSHATVWPARRLLTQFLLCGPALQASIRPNVAGVLSQQQYVTLNKPSCTL